MSRPYDAITEYEHGYHDEAAEPSRPTIVT
jgi:hypothetical protein